jgi:hypothetical protein
MAAARLAHGWRAVADLTFHKLILKEAASGTAGPR